MPDSAPAPAVLPRIGSLFSGYGGLDLAVEHVFAGRTAWFSELNPAPARVFAHHWPGIPNLGDITQVDWRQVEPVDVICGGFPCQDIFILARRTVPHPARLGRRPRRGDPGTGPSSTRHDRPLASDHRPGAERTPAPAGQGAGRVVAADRAAVRRWGRYAGAIRRWEHLTGRPAPSPALLNHEGQSRSELEP